MHVSALLQCFSPQRCMVCSYNARGPARKCSARWALPQKLHFARSLLRPECARNEPEGILGACAGTSCTTGCASPTARWWTRRCCPTATSPTATCPTRCPPDRLGRTSALMPNHLNACACRPDRLAPDAAGLTDEHLAPWRGMTRLELCHGVVGRAGSWTSGVLH